MPKKTTDPFMQSLWSALIGGKLGPGGNQTSWDETPVRIRNAFIRSVRPVLQSGAAFQASALEIRAPKKLEPKPAARAGTKSRTKHHDPRELHLPLRAGVKRDRD